MRWLTRHFQALDAIYRGPAGDALALQELAPVAGRYLPPGGRALEVGCGYGRNLVALASLEAALLVGCDPSPAQLRRARERLAPLAPAQRGRVGLARQEPFRLPFREGAFDLVVLWQVLEHVGPRRAKARVLAEAVRVLRPGGHLLIETPNQWFPVDYHDNQMPFLHWTGPAALREWLTWKVRGERYAPSQYLSLRGLQRLLREAPGVAGLERASRIAFARGFGEAWRALGGTQVPLKRVIMVLLAPVHALLAPFGGTADAFLPSLRVVFRVEKAGR